MSEASLAIPDAVVGVGVASSAADLAIIIEPSCAAAIWQRPRNEAYADWLDALPEAQLPRARVVLKPDHVERALEQVCEMHGTPDCDARAALISDATEIAHAFARIMGAPYVRLRFDVITTNACRRFHRDAVTARLVCTYRGDSTQYGFASEGEQPTEAFAVPTGSPIVLRGTRWPEEPHTGLLHRSPPIEGTGVVRSVMVVDPVFDLDAVQ